MSARARPRVSFCLGRRPSELRVRTPASALDPELTWGGEAELERDLGGGIQTAYEEVASWRAVA